MRSLRSATAKVATVVLALLFLAVDASVPAFGAWRSRQVAVGEKVGDGLFGVSCPTASIWVAVGGRGTIVTSTEPGGGADAWRSETVAPGAYVGTVAGQADRTSPGTFRSVSCPTTSRCAAVDNNGDVVVVVSTNPAGPIGSWSTTSLIPFPGGAQAPLNALFGVSCPTAEFCAAVGAGGQIFTSQEPFTAEAGRAAAPAPPGGRG